MKLTKILMCAVAVGAVTLATSRVQAVPCVVTISGTASYQGYDKNHNAIIKKHSINQKLILQLLAAATGDPSITNKPTKLLYDPDAENLSAFDSSEGFFSYGVFYVSNSVVGLMPLQGIDESGNYWSYIELDSYVLQDWWVDEILGFSSPSGTEFNYVAKESKNGVGVTGSAVLFIHNNFYAFDITGANTTSSQLFYANDSIEYYNDYALVIRGLITFKGSNNGTKTTESFSLKGSGDGLWYNSDTGEMPLVVNGNAKISGKGPSVD
jgi:hypothetical protein